MHVVGSMMNSSNSSGMGMRFSHLLGLGPSADANHSMIQEDEYHAAKTIHENITCDICRVGPIEGVRYKCCVCNNFDMCANCEATNAHHPDHPLLKIRQPCRSFAHREMQGLREMLGAKKFEEMMNCYENGYQEGYDEGYMNQAGMEEMYGGYQQDQYYGNEQFSGHPYHVGDGSGNDYHEQHHPWGQWGQYEQAPRMSGYAPSYCSDGTTARGMNGCERKAKAAFVEDVNIPDRSHYEPGLVLKKSWRMRNNGSISWGNNCFLVFVKGCRALSIEERYPVVNAHPGQMVQVSAMIRTPDEDERYCAYYRLERDGVKFGPRVWVDIFVTRDEEKLASTSNSDLSGSKVDHRRQKKDGTQKMKKEETRRPMQQQPTPTPIPEPIPVPIQQQQPPAKPDPNAVANVMSMKLNPTAQEFRPPSVSPAPEEESGFPFIDALATLVQMGFMNEEHVKYLLMEFNGNVEVVVQHLLNSMPA